MERVSYLHSTDDGSKSPKPVCYFNKELKPMLRMCPSQSRSHPGLNPLFRAGGLEPTRHMQAINANLTTAPRIRRQNKQTKNCPYRQQVHTLLPARHRQQVHHPCHAGTMFGHVNRTGTTLSVPICHIGKRVTIVMDRSSTSWATGHIALSECAPPNLALSLQIS
jgi:hypothetical protein